MPLAAVICALIALVALPILRTMQLRPLYQQMRDVSEPSRTQLSRIHASLALEQSLLRDFVEAGDTVAVARYAAAVAEERSAYAELAPLVGKLGPQVERNFKQHHELERAWHDDIQVLLSRPETERRKRDPLHARRYEALLVSAAGLDESLNAAAESSRAVLEATGRAQVWISFAIGGIALIAALLVASLGRRLGTFAMNEQSARVRLEEAIEGRARVIRGVTHDLKNPLHVISATAELLDEDIAGPLNDRQRSMLRRIRSSSRHLISMVSDLLQMSMAEGGTLTIHPEPISIRDVVRETATDYEAEAAAKGLILTTDPGEDPLDAVTDPLRVQQILQNLLSNAIKYTQA
ncbi:MAG: sensor histidine kinase, partial [Thermoanaerobaculia bacterium]